MTRIHPFREKSVSSKQSERLRKHKEKKIRAIRVIRAFKKTPTKQPSTMNKKDLWQKIIHFAITILTAIATTLGTTSCIGMMN